MLYKVRENKIVEVVGDGPQAAKQREYFGVDPARCNICELGLGTNDKAVVTGNILEDEKASGFHWAYGQSDHIGGEALEVLDHPVDSAQARPHVVGDDPDLTRSRPGRQRFRHAKMDRQGGEKGGADQPQCDPPPVPA